MRKGCRIPLFSLCTPAFLGVASGLVVAKVEISMLWTTLSWRTRTHGRPKPRSTSI